jgi:hypothetical protein
MTTLPLGIAYSASRNTMEAEMNHTLLTAVHPRTIAPVKMDARQEQEYYDRAAESQALLEKVTAMVKRIRRLARALPALTQSVRGNFGHSLPARKALH